MVVAADPYAAADGVERVAVTYEPLPAAVSAAAADRPGRAAGQRDVARQPGVGQHRRQGPARGGPGRRPGGGGRAPRLPARGRHAARDPRGPGRARSRRSNRGRAHGVDLDPGAVRGAQRHRPGAPPGRGAHPRDRARRGRRLRRQGPRLSRGDPGGGGGPAARPAGEVGRDAQRALPQRGRRSRSGPRGAHRPGARRAHRRHRDRLHARSRRVADARRGHHAEHDQPPARSVPGAALSRHGPQRAHPQDLRGGLSRRRAAGGRLRPGSTARPRGAPRSGWIRPRSGA